MLAGVVSTSTAGIVSASDSASGPPSATAVAPTNPEPSDATSITTSGPTDAPCTSTDASVNRSSPDTPEPTGPTASTDPTFNPPENLFFDQSVGRNYRKRYSRKAKQEVELPLTQQQFDACEAGPYPEEEIGRNEEGQKFIYMVRAFRDQDCGRSRYRYEGRSQGSRTKERLFLRWLTNNHMDRAWRNRTIMSHVGYWFPIPVAGTVDQRKALCTVASVAKTLEYMGLFQKMNDFLSASDFVRNPFRQVVRALQSIKGFAQHTIKNPATTFDPVLHCRHGQLYLIQIRSKKKRLHRCTDNTHAVCVFNERIFDVNHIHPLELSRVNLDRCCLDGPHSESWVYDASVRVAVFTPTKFVSRRIQKYLGNKNIL